MALRQTISDEQRRLLRILGLMPLASVSNLAPVLGMDESRVRRMLNTLRQGDGRRRCDGARRNGGSSGGF